MSFSYLNNNGLFLGLLVNINKFYLFQPDWRSDLSKKKTTNFERIKNNHYLCSPKKQPFNKKVVIISN